MSGQRDPDQETAADRPGPGGQPADGRSVQPSPSRRRRRAAAAIVRGGPHATAPTTHSPRPATTEADRRVTGSPENATIVAPGEGSATIVSRNARNGSPRTATNAGR